MDELMITIVEDKTTQESFYVDENDVKSEPFYEAGFYKNGFAKVKKTKNSKPLYRDLLGRLTKDKTESGKAFFEYVAGNITFEQINIEYFADEIFCIGIKQEVIRKAKKLATSQYNAGLIVKKSTFQHTIESVFNDIDIKHVSAKALLQAKAEAEAKMKKTKRNSDSEKDEFDETMKFLDSF